MDQWYALVAKKTSVILVGVRRKSIAGRSRDVILPLSLAKAAFGLPCPFLGSSIRERHGASGDPVKGFEDGKGTGTSLL